MFATVDSSQTGWSYSFLQILLCVYTGCCDNKWESLNNFHLQLARSFTLKFLNNTSGSSNLLDFFFCANDSKPVFAYGRKACLINFFSYADTRKKKLGRLICAYRWKRVFLGFQKNCGNTVAGVVTEKVTTKCDLRTKFERNQAGHRSKIIICWGRSFTYCCNTPYVCNCVMEKKYSRFHGNAGFKKLKHQLSSHPPTTVSNLY